MKRMLKVLREVHRNQRGVVSLETILIVGAIALPILLFLLKVGWPRVRTMFDTGLTNLETESQNVSGGTSGGGTTGP